VVSQGYGDVQLCCTLSRRLHFFRRTGSPVQETVLRSNNAATAAVTVESGVHVASQAAKGLGKSLRAFAPTLQELTSVSRDLKNTLDEELGIDEIRREFASARVRAPWI